MRFDYFDVSLPLDARTSCFPGDPPVCIEPIDDAASFRISRLSMGSHSGTHVDAPAHLADRKTTVDELDLQTLIGPCRLIDLSDQTGMIDAARLQHLPVRGQQRLLFHTSNRVLYDGPFNEDFVALTADAAAYLVECGVSLVGIDSLSVEAFQGDGSVHRILLDAGVVLLEGLNLQGVERGDYELICLPLLLTGADGAPCRAVLRREHRRDPLPEHHTGWP